MSIYEEIKANIKKSQELEELAKENEHYLISENANQIIIEIIQDPFAENKINNKLKSEYVKKGKNSVKLRNNKARAKTRADNLFNNNNWNCCITVTSREEKYRKDPNAFMKAVQTKINYFRNYYDVDIYVDLIPQKGKKGGCWHIHSPAYVQDKQIKYHKKLCKAYRALRDYLEKTFGYCTIKLLKTTVNRVKAYNYVTRDIYNDDVPYGKHIHSPSRGLREAVPISKEKALDLIQDREPNDIIGNKYNTKKRYIIQK